LKVLECRGGRLRWGRFLNLEQILLESLEELIRVGNEGSSDGKSPHGSDSLHPIRSLLSILERTNS
jgi:hypothetical protein